LCRASVGISDIIVRVTSDRNREDARLIRHAVVITVTTELTIGSDAVRAASEPKYESRLRLSCRRGAHSLGIKPVAHGLLEPHKRLSTASCFWAVIVESAADGSPWTYFSLASRSRQCRILHRTRVRHSLPGVPVAGTVLGGPQCSGCSDRARASPDETPEHQPRQLCSPTAWAKDSRGRSWPRLSSPPSRKNQRRPVQRRADLAQPLLDAVVGPNKSSARSGTSEPHIEPLLVALHLGLLDDHLAQIAQVVNTRLKALDAVGELIASSRLHVGDKVRLGHNLRPQYLHGRSATLVAQDGEKWLVRLDESVGRFADDDLRVSATQIEPIEASET
jgi:hypothetical protein